MGARCCVSLFPWMKIRLELTRNKTKFPMTTPEVTVLIIEDEPEIIRFLRTTLPRYGYRLHEACTGQEGLTQAIARNPDIILLDLGLPDMDGLEVIRRLRKLAAIPIIVLSARDQEQMKVESLDLGADDYVTKPFGINELLARMRVVLRHASRVSGHAPGRPSSLRRALRIDLERRQVFEAEKEIHLTPIEYKLLTVLVRYAGKCSLIANC